MSLEQHEDNRFTKERDDVEKYLLRIIQRYFDIENVYTQESIEAIIVESLTRYKQSIIHEKGGFIFSLNQRTGHIMLTIRDLGGEEAFEKQSAFNKDFGIKSDTICEGNDPRLKDKREPLEHKHKIVNIKDLKERLDKLISSNKTHTHKNKNILDMLIYTGTKAEIDLIVLDYLEENLKKYYDNLLYYQREEKAITNNVIEILDNYIVIIEQDLDYAKSLINNAVIWLEDAYKYTDNQVDLLKNKFIKLLLKYMTKDEIQPFKDYFSNICYMISDGEIAISNGQFNFISIVDDITANTDNKIGHSNITEQNEISINIPFYNNIKINNIKTYFRYDLNGQIITVPIPFIFKTKDGNIVTIQLKNIDNNYFIETNMINIIPSYITQDNFYNTDTVIAIGTNKISYDYYKHNNVPLCLIDSEHKNNFIKQFLQDKTYLIQGTRNSFDNNIFIDGNGNPMTYYNWDAGQPTINMYDTICINKNQKWEITDGFNKHFPIYEYKLKYLSDYFQNPRIYYQIFGTQEVT